MATREGVFLSKKEIIIGSVLEDYRMGKLSRKEAAEKLRVSEKTVQRKARKVREKGLVGLVHGNRGNTPANKLADSDREEAISLFQQNYRDFNMAHAHEMLTEKHGLKASYSSFHRWCRAKGLGVCRKRRSSKARIARERAANEGIMLQMDGSPEKWNGKDVWSIIATIDDATSDVPHAEFFPTETTWACMTVMRKVIEKKGVPELILTDEAGWSTGSSKRQNFSQFVRACGELGIKVVGTRSPESKGRIERFNRTTQDRLIPEMRLKGIKSMTDANRYLEQVYLPEWSRKRTVEPLSPTTRYKPVPEGIDLRDVFCLKKTRIVNKGHVVNYKDERYRIPTMEGGGSMWKQEVIVHEYEDGSIAIFHADKKLEAEKMRTPPRRWKRGA